MSLNDIELSPYIITQFYADKLVGESVLDKQTIKTENESVKNNDWKFLGNNNKKVFVGVDYNNVVHLPDEQLEFLTQLLKACNLSLDDVVVLNKNNNQQITHTNIINHFEATVVLLFGITLAELGFPLDAPQYQPQRYTNYTALHAPPLQDLQNDKQAKGKLWAALKISFNL